MRSSPLALALCLAAAACGGDDDDGAPPAPPGPIDSVSVACDAWAAAAGTGALPAVTPSSAFVAFGSDFQGFRSWPSFTLPGAPDVGGGAHVAGDRTIYINQVPPAGATEFATGTMIVKAIGGADPKLFAMVKRGEGYNGTGAVGWEWFEVRELNGDSLMDVEWRGVGPPDGEAYAGNAEGGCNGCHAASARDGVLSAASCN
ncbi:MAG TPA: hypothetical protein VFS43_34065 [Polyangiaceae bacterium]|nr:hypothetical protein [Polyangiaceae bacterium]